MNFDLIFLKFVPKSTIINDQGYRRQVIILTNDGSFTDAYMRQSTPMS